MKIYVTETDIDSAPEFQTLSPESGLKIPAFYRSINRLMVTHYSI